MEWADFQFLLTAVGQTHLAQLSQLPITPANHLQLATQLRQSLLPGQAQAVLETAWLRQQAAVKFDRADQMYFTRDGLEQASSAAVAHHRAQRFGQLAPPWIADLGCGLGGDALALAPVAPVLGIDRDRLRLAMARQNLRAYGLGTRFWPLLADLQQLSPLPVPALFFDPARRDEHGRRHFSVTDYEPPLSLIDHWLAQPNVSAAAVKISPGVNYAELPPAAEVEFVSLQGEVKEGLLWYGQLRTTAQRRATLLPQEVTLTDLADEETAVGPLQSYLYEPDGAVIRAHLVTQLAAQLHGRRIDETIAYLTADHYRPTPFARAFAILDHFPFHLKKLRRYLRQRDVGQLVIKKRGSPLEPDQLRAQLSLKGSQSALLFLTHIQGQHSVIVAKQIQ